MNKFIIKECRQNARAKLIMNLKYFPNNEKNDDLIIKLLELISEVILKSSEAGYRDYDLEINLKDLKLSQLQSNIGLIKSLIPTVQQMFPDRLHLCNIYNTPIFFQIFYENLIVKYLDNKTKAKINFAN